MEVGVNATLDVDSLLAAATELEAEDAADEEGAGADEGGEETVVDNDVGVLLRMAKWLRRR